MHIGHARVHRRADGLFGFGNIAHEVQGSSDTKKRHVEKREPQVVKTVFKTLEATFEGKVGGYKTVGHEPEPTKAQNRAPVITHNAQKEADKDEDEEKEEQAEKQKEAAEKKKEQEEAAKEKAAEEAAEKKKAQEDAAKEKAAEEAAAKKKQQEEDAKEKAAEESAKEKAAEEAKTRNRSKEEDEEDETTTDEPTTTKPTRTRVITTSEEHSSVPTVISEPTESHSVESVLAKATGDASPSVTVGAAEDISGSSTLSSSSATAEASTSSGTSAGAKAGIAFGVLGGLLAVGLLVFFIFNRRRKQAEMQRLENDDEKLNGPIAGGMGGPMRSITPEAPDVVETASVRTDAKAPRVSLRPVTQFLPNWNGLDKEKRTSKGAAMTLAVPASTPTVTTGPLSPRTPGGSAWERPSTAQSTDPANPFGHQAERVPSPVPEESARGSPSPISEQSTPVVATAAAASTASPQSPSSPANDPLTANGPPISAGSAAGAAAAGAGAGVLARKTSMRNNGTPRLDLTIPPGPNPPLATIPASPAGTEFSTTSAAPGTPDGSSGAAAIAAAGGPANSAVHRVQLDFKPTLDDELELKAGDLVRLLHEYDDGWALCIRLDRSRQGVVPRTCLSTRPVKPRPAQAGPRPGPPIKPTGPPRGPGPNHPQGQRPMTPQGNFGPGRPASPAGRPMTPNGSRPQSPMGHPMGPPGRPAGPMSPGPRTQSPGPFQGPPGPRSMSPGPRSQSPGPFQGPPGPRSMSPGPRSQSPGPRQGPPNRAMSPGPRSQSPGPAGGRSQSPNGMNRRNSPPGPSPMNPSQSPRPAPSTGSSTGSVNRKPVPGQAY
ncbi:hypothetical protein ACHAPT_008502 [Fusarium lateritium]